MTQVRWPDHPSNTKKGGAFIYYKDFLTLIKKDDITYLKEFLVTEITVENEKWFFTCLYRSPSQNCDQFSDFCKDFSVLLYNVNDHRPSCSVIVCDFNVNPIQDGHFWGCSRMERTKSSPLKNLSHISYNYETWHSYTLPKGDPKDIGITWHNPWVLLTSAFFHRKLANFVRSRNRNIDSILVHIF